MSRHAAAPPRAPMRAPWRQQTAPSIAEALLTGPGQTLDAAVRRDFESRFGHDFARVRVHAGEAGTRAADALGARAFSIGDRVAFSAGEYQPNSARGRGLLAHELTHVVQQRRGGAAPETPAAAGAELEARRNGALAGAGAPHLPVHHGTATGVAREPKPATAAHAGGAMGEMDAAFALGKMGFDIVLGPAGPGGHQLTAKGLDIVAYNPSTGELWIVDNKASGGTGKVSDASAITKNLKKNLQNAIDQIDGLKDFPNKKMILTKARAALASVSGKTPLPKDVKLVVTNAGGYHTGIGKALAAKGVQFVDVVGKDIVKAREADVAKAKAAGKSAGRPTSHKGTVKAAQDAAKADAKPLPKVNPESADFHTKGRTIQTDRSGNRIRSSGGPSMRRTGSRAQRFRAKGAGLAELLPAAMNALQDKMIRHRVASDMLALWPRVEKMRRDHPDHTIVFLVSLQEWARPDPAGQVARAVNYVDVFHGATEDEALAQGDGLLRAGVPEGWVEVGPFAGFIEPTMSLDDAREHAESQEGCFIATACYGSANAAPVRLLRDFRDAWLLQRPWGRRFVVWYYRHAPAAADLLQRHPAWRRATRVLFVTPLVHCVRGARCLWWPSGGFSTRVGGNP